MACTAFSLFSHTRCCRRSSAFPIGPRRPSACRTDRDPHELQLVDPIHCTRLLAIVSFCDNLSLYYFPPGPRLLPRPSLSILCRQPLILEDSSSSFPFELGHQFIAASLQYMTAGPGAASKNAVPERHVRTTPDACGR